MKHILRHVRISFVMLLLMTILLGSVYPLMVTLLAQGMFHHQAGGSLIRQGGAVVGSSLLGQEFRQPRYFWGRLSATTPPYNAAASSGSNLSPANPKLLDAVNVRIAALQKADPKNKRPIPIDLVTSSASGLDPHITVEAMRYQLPRVAQARKMKESDVEALAAKMVQTPLFGAMGISYVNVVELNRALDGK